MYLRRCEGNSGVFRLVVFFWKIVVGAADSLYARRSGSSNMSVAVSPFAPSGAAVGVAMGGCFMVCASQEASPASTVSLVLFACCVL